MRLIYYPNPILSKKCRSVPNSGVGQKIKDRSALAAAMWKIMNDNSGVGLAAPQVGLNARVFVWNNKGSQIYNQVIWNPVLNCVRGCMESIEGCLSLPKVSVIMQRATSSILTGTGINGKPLLFVGDAITTRIWEHEIDHLNGKLIIHDMNYNNVIANQDAIKTLLKNRK